MTIKKVADKAGVSTATVSRLINKSGYIGEDTRKKIKLAMKETNYTPSLRKQRQSRLPRLKYDNVLMLWTSGSGKYGQQSLAGQDMMLGVNDALQQTGVNLTIAQCNTGEGLPLSLQHGKFDGVLIQGSIPSAAICEYLKQFPVVWLLQSGADDFGDRVKPDHSAAAILSYNYLIKAGCKNLCCISYAPTAPHFEYWQTRADSFIRHAELYGIPCNLLTIPEPVNTADQIAAAAANLVDNFCQLNPRPDGLFCSNNLGAAVHTELLQRGIVPMKDVYLIAGDEKFCSQYHLVPKPATIQIFSREIGKQAVETLLQRIKTPNVPQITSLIKPALITP